MLNVYSTVIPILLAVPATILIAMLNIPCIQIRHFRFCYFLNLFLRDFTYFVFIRYVSRAFFKSGCFKQITPLRRGFSYKAK